MPRHASLILVGLAACGGGDATIDAPRGGGHDGTAGGSADAFVQRDAPAGPFGCLGQPIPSGAPDRVTLGGMAQTLNGTTLVPASGVTVAALDADNASITSAVTDGSGAYSLSLATGGHPLDMYLRASLSGDRDTTLFPPTALYEDSNAGYILIVTQSDFDFAAQLSGVTQSSSKGVVGIDVIDCAGHALAGATVSTSPGGTVVYVSNGMPDTSATSTDTSGVAIVFNVPAGEVTVSATVNGMTLRSHAVNAIAGVTTTTAIRP